MADRFMGVETEYAVTAFDRARVPMARTEFLGRLIPAIRERHPTLLDATGRGIFLANGARMYIDAPDHPEYATGECANPWDVVRYIQSGERLLEELVAEPGRLGMRVAELVVLRTNVDYRNRTTWGTHENYCLRRTDRDLLGAQIIPHLVSRLVYAGAGGFDSRATDQLTFLLSPRVVHLTMVTSPYSQHDRPLVHQKEESHALDGYQRLHLICGESLCSEIAAWLKVATTAVIVALIEGGERPGDAVQIRAPLGALRDFAADPTCRATAATASGPRTAVEMQRHYLECAERHVGASFMPPWTGEVCHQWRCILDRLAEAPDAVATTLDWAIKLSIFRTRAERRGIAWDSVPHWNALIGQLRHLLTGVRAFNDWPAALAHLLAPRSGAAEAVRQLTPFARAHRLDWDALPSFIALRDELFETDLRYGQLGPSGLFGALDRAGVLTHHMPGVDNIPHAIAHPPATGRAAVRGALVRQLSGSDRYVCDWSGVWDRQAKEVVDLRDPFTHLVRWQRADPELTAWLRIPF
jgi:hypothetical protein